MIIYNFVKKKESKRKNDISGRSQPPDIVQVTTFRPKDNCGQLGVVPGTPCTPSSKNSACTACAVYNRGWEGVSRGSEVSRF